MRMSFPRETPFCYEKAKVFLGCCSLMAKQSLQGSVLQLGCVAEHPGAQPLLCLPALTSWGDHPLRRRQDGLFTGSRTQKAGGAADHIKGAYMTLYSLKCACG